MAGWGIWQTLWCKVTVKLEKAGFGPVTSWMDFRPVILTPSQQPSVVKPGTLIIWVSEKGILHNLKLCKTFEQNTCTEPMIFCFKNSVSVLVTSVSILFHLYFRPEFKKMMLDYCVFTLQFNHSALAVQYSVKMKSFLHLISLWPWHIEHQ